MTDINKESHPDNKAAPTIPSLKIIDLDRDDVKDRNDIPFEESVSDEFTSPTNSAKKDLSEEPTGFLEKYIFRINWHIVLLVVILCSVIFIVYRFNNWGKRVESFFDPDNLDTEYVPDVLDNILPPLTDAAEDDGIRTVVALGNAPFADDKNTDNNLAALIQDLTNAQIYNCAVSNSYLAAAQPTFDANAEPMDAFNLYWLTTLITMDNDIIYERAFQSMGENIPADAKEAYETLSTLDFNTVDVITIMYDASDYLDGRLISNPENHTDIQSFYGNMNASIELLQETFPHIRIIVMSPTYAYAIDENGEYVSSDIYLYSEHPLSRYAMMLEMSATGYSASFLDHFYGTVNEVNAAEYLTDHLHLNPDGRKKVAERFVYALEYYD